MPDFPPAADIEFAVPFLGPVLTLEAQAPQTYCVGLGAEPVRGEVVGLCWIPLQREGASAWRIDRGRLRQLGDSWRRPVDSPPSTPEWFAEVPPRWVTDRCDPYVLLLLAYATPRGLAVRGHNLPGRAPWFRDRDRRRNLLDAIGATYARDWLGRVVALPAPPDRSGVWFHAPDGADAVEDLGAAITPEKRNPGAACWLRAIARWVRKLQSHKVPLGVFQLTPDPVGPAPPLCVALGSCAYPAGILDRVPATAAWERLNRRCHTGSGAPPELMFLTGDQIYADATAGLLDPARPEDRYRSSYEALLAEPRVRSGLRRMPVIALLDDHEIDDNWEPIPPPPSRVLTTWDAPVETAAERDYRVNCARLAEGLAQFRRYQRPSKRGGTPPLWFHLECRDVPIFVMDTRTERTLRNAETLDTAEMFGLPASGSGQEVALHAWLRQRLDRPRFVVSPAAIFPRARNSAPSTLLCGTDMTAAAALRADDFSAFPGAWLRLLRLIADLQLHHLVFLSGDLHLGLFTRITLRKIINGGPVTQTTIHCVHSPGLYTPYPFANAAPADLLLNETLVFEDPQGAARYECEVRAEVAEGAGFVFVSVERDAVGWKLSAEFDGACRPTRFHARI